MPRLTNSTTAWEDWQSQIPSREPVLADRAVLYRFKPSLTVASKYEELVIVGQVVDHNIGVCGNDLLLGCQLGALLELKIANSSRESQISVHATKVDETASSSDTSLLA